MNGLRSITYSQCRYYIYCMLPVYLLNVRACSATMIWHNYDVPTGNRACRSLNFKCQHTDAISGLISGLILSSNNATHPTPGLLEDLFLSPLLFPLCYRLSKLFILNSPTTPLGEGWVQELLNGHPKCIQCELGVTTDVFQQLIAELHAMSHGQSRYVSLEEQLAIFLYMCVTGLTIWHAGERFQHSNATISKWVLEFQLVFVGLFLKLYQILQKNGPCFFWATLLHKTHQTANLQ